MAARRRIDINCDMGEGFGRWTVGDDTELMPFVTSVNIAAGYHAGDPTTIRATVEAAVQWRLQIGVHVALPDLLGFGRREMRIEPSDLTNYCLYQIGAVAAFASAADARIAHVKPHGALYAMASRDPEVAGAIAEAVAQLDPTLPLLLLNRTCQDAVEARGIRLLTEGFPDLAYAPDGQLVLERTKLAWDPSTVADRALDMVINNHVVTTDGTELELEVDSLCVHGDAPNAVDIARQVRRALTDAGIEAAPFNPHIPA